MGFSLSPSVTVTETDQTLYVPNVATSIGATVGDFAWGPVDEVTQVTSERTLVEKFGQPDDVNYKDWFSAMNFLAYSDNLKLVRVLDDTLGINAAAGADQVPSNQGEYLLADTDPILIKNSSHKDAILATVDATTNGFIAKYPGTAGNNLLVSACDSTSWATYTYEGYFNAAPVDDEIYVTVLKGGEVVETFYGSKDPDSTDPVTGGSGFIVTMVNRTSKYIWMPNPLSTNAPTTPLFEGTPGSYTAVDFEGALTGGVDDAPASADYQAGWDLFKDDESWDISLLITGGITAADGDYVIDNVAATRKDCVAFVSTLQSDVVNGATPVSSMSTTRQTFGSSSYAFMDGNYKYQYDKYNDVYRWLPFNGDIAGLAAYTDYVTDPWWSIAGLNRGRIKNVIKLAFNPSKAERDDMYKDSINPIVSFRGEGPVLFGDRTLLTKPSAFDRINVRRLFIVLEKAISTAAKYMLFEFNDTYTRERFVDMVEPYLRNVKGRRGVYDYKVICDETNNTGEVIDKNEFIGDIYIKPTRSINFVHLNFIAMRTDVTFEEALLAEG